LRWLSECTQERLAHPFPVTEARFSRDDLDRVTSRLHHQSSGFNAKKMHAVLYGERDQHFPVDGSVTLNGSQSVDGKAH
jgi:hypothetical protein